MNKEAVRNSETSVYFNETTWHIVPESYHVHTRCRENMKSQSFHYCPIHTTATKVFTGIVGKGDRKLTPSIVL